ANYRWNSIECEPLGVVKLSGAKRRHRVRVLAPKVGARRNRYREGMCCVLWLRTRRHHRRRSPGARHDLLGGPEHTQRQIEACGWRRKPVALLVGAGRIVLDVKIERAIRIELQRVAIADSKALDGVGGKVAVIVVERKRPESFDRRELAFFEVQAVTLGALEGPAGGTLQTRKVNRVLRRQYAQEKPRSQCAHHVVRAIASIFAGQAPSGVPRLLLAAVKAGQRRGRSFGAFRDGVALLRRELHGGKWLSGDDADGRQALHQRSVFRVRWILNQELCEQLKEL